MAGKNFIQKAIKHPGALRESTGTPKGKNIPVSTLQRLSKKSGKTGQRARFALTLRKLRK